jgi:hypothetical protein
MMARTPPPGLKQEQTAAETKERESVRRRNAFVLTKKKTRERET